MRLSLPLLLVGGLLFAPSVLLAPSAGAQTDHERSVTRSTAKSGIEAYREGRFEDAVELLTRAESVIHAPTHLLYIARSQAKLGRLVEAKEAYIKVINDQLDDKAPPAFVKAQEEARTELEALQGRLASLKIVVTGAERSEVQVKVDDKPLPNIALGVSTDASPGERHLVVSAPGKTTQELTVQLAEGQSETVTIELLDDASATSEEVTTAPEVTTEIEDAPRSSKKMIGFVLGGVGVAGLGVGTAFGIMTLSDAKKAREDDSLCPDEQCSSDGDEAISKAKTKALVANIGIGVGAALVAVGGYLVITAPKSGQEVVRLTPEGPGVAGVSLKGAF